MLVTPCMWIRTFIYKLYLIYCMARQNKKKDKKVKPKKGKILGDPVAMVE